MSDPERVDQDDERNRLRAELARLEGPQTPTWVRVEQLREQLAQAKQAAQTD